MGNASGLAATTHRCDEPCMRCLRINTIAVQTAWVHFLDMTERAADRSGQKRRVVVGDLFSRPALIPRNLLILQLAQNAKTATTANLSFSFHSFCSLVTLTVTPHLEL